MKQIKKKMLVIFGVVLVGIMGSFQYHQLKSQEYPTISISPCIEIPYGNRENMYYVPEDELYEGQVVLAKGYYEEVHILEGKEFGIYIPIDPKTLERLPSDQFQEGTKMEIDGQWYVIHVQNNEYSATLLEE